MRSESDPALGQPRDTKPTLGMEDAINLQRSIES